MGCCRKQKIEVSKFFIKNSLLWKILRARKGRPISMDNRKRLDIIESVWSTFLENSQRIRKETERYAQRRNNSGFSLSMAEVKCSVGILILRGYHILPTRKNYWEQQPDMVTKIVSINRRRNRFEEILQSFHVVNSNNLPEDTKIGRVLEYLVKLRRNFKAHWMVKYFGRYRTFLNQ